MTWDETLELAKQVTAERDGVKYKGLSFGYNIPGMVDTSDYK
ncbi:hypothetical protein [Paenibacillus sp. MER TA 81-3]|nr:hypothetical protein [Paenibacillus sp. MER TA 81-3]